MPIVIGNKTISKISIGGKTVSKIEIGGKIAYELDESPDYLCFTDVSGSVNTLKLTKNNSSSGSAPTVSLEYSTDKVNWTTWTESNNARTYTIPANGKVYLRGDNTAFDNSNGYHVFSSTRKLKASGDLMTIIDKTGQTKTLGDYAFRELFYNCTTLVTPPDLSNITSVGEHGMKSMFLGCTSLTTPPDLSNITSVGEYGMSRMFQNCTALTTGPDLSSITSVNSEGMYRMFLDCTSLTTPPDLSNTTSVGEYGMSRMFYGCTALTTGPDLSSITSVGEYGMESMFSGCTALTEAYAPTITWDTSKTENWLYKVAASGTLYAKSTFISSIPTSDDSGCPSRWTKQSL